MDYWRSPDDLPASEKSWKTSRALQYGRVIDLRTSPYRTWLACLILAFGTLAIYWPARHYGFVDYDDNTYVFNNPTVRAGLSWWGLVWSFVDQHASNWHPFTWFSLMLDCQLFGVNAGALHMVNVLFHCANAALLLLLLNSMTGAFWRSAIVAALFAWHPLRVESVAWISERKDVLSGFFFMLTLWMYVLHVKRGISSVAARTDAATQSECLQPRRRSIFYRLALGFFVLGLLSKPMLVTVPLVLLLLDFWPLNRFAAVSQSPSGTKIVRGLVLEKLPFFLFAMVIGIIAFLAQREGGATTSAPSLGFVPRMGDAIVGYLGYLEKLFWPHNLSCLYLRPGHIKPGTLLLAVLILAGICFLAAANFRRRPYLAMGWVWFLVMILPVSGLIQFGLQSIADRYTYLPAIGLFIMCVWGMGELVEFLLPSVAQRLLPGIAATVILGACALMSRHQLAYWQNTETLMEHALKIDPDNYVAHGDLGVYFSRIGRTKDALIQYQLECEMDPNSSHHWENVDRSHLSPSPAAPK